LSRRVCNETTERLTLDKSGKFNLCITTPLDGVLLECFIFAVSLFTLAKNNRVVRKLQFLNNFFIKKHFYRAKTFFNSKKYRTCETTNRVVKQVQYISWYDRGPEGWLKSALFLFCVRAVQRWNV
jgi:hypothetical protein